MHSIIVVPGQKCGPSDAPGQRLTLEPGESLSFGRSSPAVGQGLPTDRHLTIPDPAVSRTAGLLTAAGAYWTLSNLSSTTTYVVENPEGSGEHIKISPGRLEAPVPFEFSRVVLPSKGVLPSFDVWAPRHEYVAPATHPGEGELTVWPFPLDRTKRYFAVLVALCEPRLRDEPHTTPPTAEQVAERLRPVWDGASRTTVQWNISYLAEKLRVHPGTKAPGARAHGKKDLLVSLALRFNVVCEDDLALLPSLAARCGARR